MGIKYNDLRLREERKKTLVNRKLSELFQRFESRHVVISEFLIWFGEMEKSNWNGQQKRRA